jgi:hypothetical protein
LWLAVPGVAAASHGCQVPGPADPIERQEPAPDHGPVVQHHEHLAGLVEGDVDLRAAPPAQERREHKDACVGRDNTRKWMIPAQAGETLRLLSDTSGLSEMSF